MKRLLPMALVLGMISAAGAAWAGFHGSSEVYVGSGFAVGALGSARNSADGTQYIGCATYGSAGSTRSMQCYANDSAGHYGSCSSSDATLVATAGTLSSNSYVTFNWNSSGTCTYLYVVTNSYFPPPGP